MSLGVTCVHPSTFLACSWSSEGLVLVTLGVRQHLDGLVVFEGSDRRGDCRRLFSKLRVSGCGRFTMPE